MKYRSEIDGLRTVAVVPVILFHAGVPGFSGGFVGVDIFFVISGFLITTILVDDLERGDFSILRFYERRARRILPALFVMMAACLPFAWAWMIPAQFNEFAKSLIAVCLFVSNILFWREDNYFAPAAEEKPLLHTWSLAVEEQYYLVFPVALFLLWFLGRRRVGGVILLVTVFSYGLMEWAMRDPRVTPTAVFYLLPTRAWELLAGAFCATLIFRRGPQAHQGLSAVGLLMLVLAISVIDKSVPFPSAWTLLPVIGTCLVLVCATPATVTGRLLSLPLMVGIGLISYSAYLWHQPLLAFARIRSLTDPSLGLMLGLSALSLGLGWISWRYVERPFRSSRRPFPRTRSRVFVLSGIGMTAFSILGLIVTGADGVPSRLPPQAMTYLAASTGPGHDFIAQCQTSSRQVEISVHPVAGCLFAPEGQAPEVVVMGDSHAGAISHALWQALRERNVSTYVRAVTGCVGLPGFYRVDWPARNCEARIQAVLEYARQSGARTLIISSRLPYYYHSDAFDNGAGKGDPVNIDRVGRGGGTALAREQRVLEGYRAALEALAQEFEVIIVRPIPPIGWDVPTLLARAEMFGAPHPAPGPRTAVEAWMAPVTDLLDAAETEGLIVQVDPMADLCPAETGRCMYEQDGEVLYFDDDHLSEIAAQPVARRVWDSLEALRLTEQADATED